MTSLLFDLCINRRDAAPALMAHHAGDFIIDWIAADIPDVAVLDLAGQLDRVLVTEAAAFDDLILSDSLAPPRGVVLIRTLVIERTEPATRFAALAPPPLARVDGDFDVVGLTRRHFRDLPYVSSP